MTVEVAAWNFHKDGWIQTEAAFRVQGVEGIALDFFLPLREGSPDTKVIAILDGTNVIRLTLVRGRLTSSGLIAARDGVVALQLISEYVESTPSAEARALGAVLTVRMADDVAADVQRHFGSPCPPELAFEHPEAPLVGSRFDADFYADGIGYGRLPANLLLHYLTIGWRAGRNPCADFSTNAFMRSADYDPENSLTPFAQHCLAQAYSAAKDRDEPGDIEDPTLWSGEDPADLDGLWAELAGAGRTELRPDFRFDAQFYGSLYRDVGAAGARAHYNLHGRAEGRFPNRYQLVRSQVADIDTEIQKLIRESRLETAIAAGQPRAAELAYELMALGAPVDQQVSDFSRDYYLNLYKDIAKSGVDPLQHLISHGLREGRRTLRQLRSKMTEGALAFDPEKPTCLVCSHDFSRTGAPIVALKLARDAAKTHNVVVATLRDGPLAPDFVATCCLSLVTTTPYEDFEYLGHAALDAVSFGILNSVESFPFSKVLVARGIPYSAYIHEYTEYTLPAYKTKLTSVFTDFIVFSAEHVRASWEGVFKDVGFNIERDSMILPQEDLSPSLITNDQYSAARETVSRLIGTDCNGRRLIYGAGQVQLRKGTDIFAMIAQHTRQIDPTAIFLWIGDGHNHEDISFGAWLDFQLRHAGVNDPGGNLFFVPAGPYYTDVCKAADVMLLTSRLDPLPNVVFDAVRYGAEVVLFQNASGFSDDRYLASPMLHAVNYGSVSDAAEKLLSLDTKADKFAMPARRKSSRKSRTVQAAAQTPFARISGHFRNLEGLKQSTRAAGSVESPEACDYDVPVLFENTTEHAGLRARERGKIWAYGRKMIWRSRRDAEEALRTNDNWMHERSRIVERSIASDEQLDQMGIPPYGLHIHAYYTDGLAEEMQKMVAYRRASRIVCTTDTDAKAGEILDMAQAAGLIVETRLVSNRGRDILPFLELVRTYDNDPDDMIWCHIHQKKSIGSASTGDAWRAFLMRTLLGDETGMSSAITEIAAKGTGLVTALDPYIVGWDSQRRLLPALGARIGRALPAHPLLFPVGNMFWVRTSVVRRMNAAFGEDYPWPNEPIPNDGTIYHAIERLWPAMARLIDLDSVFVDAPGLARV